MKKIILFCLFVLLLASFVSATDFTTNNEWWISGKTESITDDSEQITFTNEGVTISGGNMIFNSGESDHLNLGNNLRASDNVGTVVARLTLDVVTGSNDIFALGSTASSNPVLIIRIASSKLYFVFRTDGASSLTLCEGATTLTTGTEYQLAISSTGSAFEFNINGATESFSCGTGSNNGLWFNDIGTTYTHTYTHGAYRGSSTLNYIDGSVQWFAYYSTRLTTVELLELYNEGSNYNPYAVEEQFELTASNLYNSSTIEEFNATFVNATDTETILTTNGSIFYYPNLIYNITVESNDYFDSFYTDYNTNSINLEAELTPFFYAHNETYYSNYTLYSSTNYVRKLNYDFNVTCRTGTTTNLSIYVNDTYATSELLTCYNDKHEYSGSYQHDVEGNQSFYFHIFNEDGNETFGENTFLWDLENPKVTVNFTNVGTFSILANASLICTDTVTPILTYNLTFNTDFLFYGNLSNGTLQYNTSDIISGSNTAYGSCSDFVSKTTDTFTQSVYANEIILIDEIDKTNFDVTNITDVRVYYSDEEFYSFTDEGTNAVNVTSVNNTKLRFRLEYPRVEGQEIIITRYIDMSLIDTESLRVCANKDGVTHYEQQLISSGNKAVVLKSSFADCIIAADYTRFAYQDAFILKAYSISTLYYLYTFDGDDQVLLASVDGSIATYMNLDTLEFQKQGYDMNILGDGLSFEKDGATQVKIYYKNNDDSNTAIQVTITDLSTSTQVFSTSAIADPNEFTIYFNYATLNVTNSTLYQITVTKTTAEGESTIKRYYSPNTQGTGYIRNELAMVLGALLTIFGLTFVAPRLTFSWFGIIMLLFSVAALSFAVGAWYINFFIFINIILIVFSFILMTNQNYPTVAG